MKIFVYEFVTGGGMLAGEPAPGLVHEADLMLRTLLRDLATLPGIACVTTRDPRLPPLRDVEVLVPTPGEGPFDLYRRGLFAAEWVWPTAPETGGILERLGRLALAEDRRLLGSHPDAVKLTAGKRATARHLARHGIAVVPTPARDDDVPLEHGGAWVVKPDDGAGAEGMVVVADRAAGWALLGERGPGHILQPWLDGVPASLSLLCAGGQARVAACNRQHLRLVDGTVRLTGITVNGERSRAAELGPLAERIAAAIPGLWGPVGVDLLLTSDGPVVLEVNPRLTTSWCGLAATHQTSPAAWVLELARTGRLPPIPSPLEGGVVDLDLEPAGVR